MQGGYNVFLGRIVWNFDSYEELINIFGLLSENNGDGEAFRAGNVLQMFRVEAKHSGINTEEEISFVRYMYCTKPADKIDEILGCARLRRSTSDDVGYS